MEALRTELTKCGASVVEEGDNLSVRKTLTAPPLELLLCCCPTAPRHPGTPHPGTPKPLHCAAGGVHGLRAARQRHRAHLPRPSHGHVLRHARPRGEP